MSAKNSLERLQDEIRELLKRVNPADLERFLVLQGQLLENRVKAYQTLLEARERVRHPKDKELTDFDRKTMLEAATASIQADYELAHGLENLVNDRVTLYREKL